MKQILAIIAFLAIGMSFLTGCDNSDLNSLTLKNAASNKIYINFRGSLIGVEPNETMVLKDIDRGTYAYETTFEVPAGTTTAKSEGAVSGQVTLDAGTKILIHYSSIFTDGTYTLGATISSSDDISSGNDDNPVLP
ncbi:MAG: hypothetical protein JSW63_05720 [Ignavibacterium sp.]|nr:MAG: hypothetical protein JSW63_05720 [Ignavibacterium sp.]